MTPEPSALASSLPYKSIVRKRKRCQGYRIYAKRPTAHKAMKLE